jgi:hypothetical protein
MLAVDVGPLRLLVRVTSANSLSEAAREDAIGGWVADCFSLELRVGRCRRTADPLPDPWLCPCRLPLFPGPAQPLNLHLPEQQRGGPGRSGLDPVGERAAALRPASAHRPGASDYFG